MDVHVLKGQAIIWEPGWSQPSPIIISTLKYVTTNPLGLQTQSGKPQLPVSVPPTGEPFGFIPLTKCFQRDTKEHDLASAPMPPLTCPLSPGHPVYYRGTRACPMHPSSALFTRTDRRRSLPCPGPYQKGRSPLFGDH